MVPLWQKKSVWQVTTIIQPALCHLVTSHFQEIACNWTPKDQIRWPIFLMLLCMIVLTEKTSKFPQPIIFWILVFSCHKMTLITKITWMPHQGKEDENWLIWKTSWPMAGWIIAPEEDSDLDLGWLGGRGAINKTGLVPLFWSIWRCLAIKVAGRSRGLADRFSWVGKPD